MILDRENIRILRPKDLQRGFLTAFLLSALWIIFIPAGFWSYTGCVIIGCAYVAYYHYHSEREHLTQQFGDSLYYLGFLMTVTALIISLLQIDDSGKNIEEIFSLFSTALVTTLAGLLGRVMYTHFNESLDAATIVAEKSLTQKTTHFIAELGASSAQLQQFHEERMNEMNSDIIRSREAFQELLNHSITTIKDHHTSIESGNAERQKLVQDKFDDLIVSAEATAKKLNAIELPDELFAKSLAPSVERASEKLDGIQIQLDRAADAFAKIADRNNELSVAFQGSLKFVEGFVATHEKYQTAAREFENMTSAMKKGATSIGQFSDTTQQESIILTRHVADMKDELEKLTSLRSSMTERVSELSDVCQSLATGLVDTGQFVADRIVERR